MKKTKFLFLILMLFISVFQAECKSKKDPSLHCIDSLYDVILNGCRQKILIQANNVDNPILLYLHGGPGSSTLMWSHVYDKKLKENFVYVNWDQRGTAFSYHEGMDSTKISEDQIADDALELIKYLLVKFHQKKVYLIGHSFGSVIGLQLVANHPELFHAYIGVGQVVDFERSKLITYKWLHKILQQANDTVGLKRIEANKFPYIDLVSKYGGHHKLTIDIDSIKRASPYYYDGYLDLAKKGKEFSQYYVAKNPNPKAVLNKSLSEIKVPLYFFEGVNDHVIACAPELVVDYCEAVKAPHKEIIWFYNSAHIISVEEPEKFQDELIRIKTEYFKNNVVK